MLMEIVLMPRPSYTEASGPSFKSSVRPTAQKRHILASHVHARKFSAANMAAHPDT